MPYSPLDLHQSHDDSKFTPSSPSTLNNLLSSASHITFPSFYALKNITLLVWPGMSQISPPSHSLLIFALLTQRSLFLLPLRRICPLFPCTPMSIRACLHYTFYFFFLTTCFELSIGHICSFLPIYHIIFIVVVSKYYLQLHYHLFNFSP